MELFGYAAGVWLCACVVAGVLHPCCGRSGGWPRFRRRWLRGRPHRSPDPHRSRRRRNPGLGANKPSTRGKPVDPIGIEPTTSAMPWRRSTK